MELIKAETIEHYHKIRELYQSSFPKCEKKPFRLIKYKQKQGMADMWYIAQDGEFTGLAITLHTSEMVLLDYFAVSQNKRNSGMGGMALCMLQNYYSDKKFFLEIESPAIPSQNQQQREKRKKFYLNHGMREMGILADVFGTEMELLGYHCNMTFEEYVSVYKDVYGDEKAANIRRLSEK